VVDDSDTPASAAIALCVTAAVPPRPISLIVAVRIASRMASGDPRWRGGVEEGSKM